MPRQCELAILMQEALGIDRRNVRALGAILLLLVGCRENSEKQAAGAQTSTGSNSVPHRLAEIIEPRRHMPVMVDPPAGPNAEAPNLFVSSDTVLCSWIENPDGHPSIRWARFAKNQWTAANTVISSDELVVNWADVPAIAEAGNQIWVAFPEERRGREGYRAELVSSTDGGKTFFRKGPLHSDLSDAEHGFASFIPEDKNTIRAFWLDGRGTLPTPGKTNASLAMGLYSAVVGASVTGEKLLDDRTCDCCNLAAGLAKDGAIVAYRDRDEKEVRDISVAYAVGPEFVKPASIHEDGYRIAGCPVNGPALATNDSRVALAWYTYANEEPRINVAFSEDSGRHFGATRTIAESNGSIAPLGRVSVAWADANDAIIGYVENEREKGQIVLRRVNSDGTVHAPLVVADTQPDRKSGFPKMVSIDQQILLVFTEAQSPSHLRAKVVPWAAIPKQTSPEKPQEKGTTAGMKEGDVFPAFEVKTTSGKTISTTSLRGKPALVNMWASYCEPCRQEVPNLSRIHEKFKKKGLKVVGLTMDERMTGEALDKLAKRREIEYPLWQDPEDRAGKALGVRVLPVTFLVDAKGKIVFVRRGAIQEDDPELEKAIQRAL